MTILKKSFIPNYIIFVISNYNDIHLYSIQIVENFYDCPLCQIIHKFLVSLIIILISPQLSCKTLMLLVKNGLLRTTECLFVYLH